MGRARSRSQANEAAFTAVLSRSRGRTLPVTFSEAAVSMRRQGVGALPDALVFLNSRSLTSEQITELSAAVMNVLVEQRWNERRLYRQALVALVGVSADLDGRINHHANLETMQAWSTKELADTVHWLDPGEMFTPQDIIEMADDGIRFNLQQAFGYISGFEDSLKASVGDEQYQRLRELADDSPDVWPIRNHLRDSLPSALNDFVLTAPQPTADALVDCLAAAMQRATQRHEEFYARRRR